ncbi:MAG: phosphoserine transaminase [Myxococcota bacterium]|nr:phosphoserine transaminase [bacterium]MDP6074513.1 phosphoserine transaminase [Myxococcota bacterium]MDP6243505.1 phosphoserine transaminase [Myxococcota bacterium]MDP7073898.1 phosphoserine transaminase [Myxococcota bacterium]MDP7300411.1 phosphoserine transaminase [Myxococcota bacterium]
MKPERRPRRPQFSSGPCVKRPGWTPDVLAGAVLGRSHRGAAGKDRIRAVIDRSRALLGLPEGWRLAVVPGSDTGAFEMALWGLLGSRPVDVLAWESFGQAWVTDVGSHLGLEPHVLEAPYGELPALDRVDFSHDVVFPWNGTTSGVRVPNDAWIPAERDGLVLCDATSAVFSVELSWEKLDVATWSWQKVLGGEAGHGMLALSPRAVERLESWTPPWPLPKVFRLTQRGKVDEALFEGSTINTPSLLCVEDALDALAWAERSGGLAGLVARSESNFAAVAEWVAGADWVEFLARDPATRSRTAICLEVVDPWFQGLDETAQRKVIAGLVGRLEEEAVAYDVAGYRDAPPGLRIWGGATVEREDIEALLPWLDWAFSEVRG